MLLAKALVCAFCLCLETNASWGQTMGEQGEAIATPREQNCTMSLDAQRKEGPGMQPLSFLLGFRVSEAVSDGLRKSRGNTRLLNAFHFQLVSDTAACSAGRVGCLSCGLGSSRSRAVRGDRAPGQRSWHLLSRPSHCHLTWREDEGTND